MNCKEAQELFGMMPELPDNHPQRRMLEWHTLGCESCAAEYQIWKESLNAMHAFSVEISDEQAEGINRRVMDRIYAESPWLAPQAEEAKVTRGMRQRVSIWAACFLAVFLCSFLLLMMGNSKQHNEAAKPMTGILPAVVAVSDIEASEEFTLTLPSSSRGIIEPFAAQMGPSYPQYWMILSMAGMGLALFSWKGIRRARR
ncbi:zf-HC2 domain-containing protein [Paenibacillus segetis]|uniref:Zf-HC2 domain-containing protein n=1 Tax=Paenibacillus segetis TaxID=1325360 RepID=A0ABQ1YH98_9BACL|nr:zf-HC2 domain-containing protein [Paenibacillus segetis]GGH24314.1 hypothetical protein GCM10008013_24000 [Paenibacillus segetis]